MRVKRFLLLQFLKLLPFQGAGLLTVYPRVLPWARSFCPFRAQVCLLLIPRVLSWARSFCPFRAQIFSIRSAGVSKFAPHALKGQKLTAQGIALGSFVCRTVALKGQKLSISEPYTKKGLPLMESPFLRL